MAKIHQHRFDKTIELVNLGDLHRGSEAHNNKLLKTAIDYIAKTKHCYWVSTGDCLDVALRDSLSDVYSNMPLGKEYDTLVEELRPIASKCLGVVESNHHKRFEKAVGMSLDKIFCQALNIPFLGALGLVNITCGRAAYYVAMHHGIGGGRMRGGKANNMERFADIIPGADLYLQGHTHTFDHFVNTYPVIDRKRKIITKCTATFAVTGHFLNWDGSYAQEKLYRPSTQGAAHMVLEALPAGNHTFKKNSRRAFQLEHGRLLAAMTSFHSSFFLPKIPLATLKPFFNVPSKRWEYRCVIWICLCPSRFCSV